MILTPDAVDVVRSFLACPCAGVIAVPVYPPLPVNSPRKLEILRVIAASCQPAAVLAGGPDAGGPDCRPLFDGLAPELTGLPWVPVGEAPRATRATTAGACTAAGRVAIVGRHGPPDARRRRPGGAGRDSWFI